MFLIFAKLVFLNFKPSSDFGLYISSSLGYIIICSLFEQKVTYIRNHSFHQIKKVLKSLIGRRKWNKGSNTRPKGGPDCAKLFPFRVTGVYQIVT